VRRLAARRGAGVEHALPRARAEDVRDQLRSLVLHVDDAGLGQLAQKRAAPLDAPRARGET
jgi:hypothetical protein